QDIINIKLIDKYWKYLENESEKILAVKNNSIKDEERRFKLINTTILNKDSILSYSLKENNIDLFNSINQASNNFENLKDKVLKALNNLRSEEHTSELQSRFDLLCRLLLEKK